MILVQGSGSGRAWLGRTRRGATEVGAEPCFHQVWRTDGPGVGPFSCREAGQMDEQLEQGKGNVMQSPEAGGGLPGVLQVPAQPRPCQERDPASSSHTHLMP